MGSSGTRHRGLSLWDQSCLYSYSLDLLVLEHFGPEAGQNVRILDFNHSELLQDTVVQAEFLFLEARDNLVTNVEGEEVVKLGVCLDLPVMCFHLVSHGANIISILEKGGCCLLTLLDVVNILLSVTLLAFKTSKFLLNLVACAHSLSHCFDVVDLALDPVVELDVRVAQALASHLQGLAQLLSIRVMEDELVGV